MPISIFDILAGIILIFSIVQGVRNGFVIELASTVGFVLGILGAILIGGWFETFLNRWFTWQYLGIVSFFIVFFAIVITTHYLAITLTAMMKLAAINIFNRIAGAIFSCFKYAFIISILIMTLNFFAKEGHFLTNEEMAKSKLYKPLEQISPLIFPWIDFSKTEAFINQ
jgi:membrane protein required for colicin V production